MIIPNKDLSDVNVINHGELRYRRIKWQINLLYSTSIDQLKTICDKISDFISDDKEGFAINPGQESFAKAVEFGSVQVEIESPVVLGSGDYFGETGLISQAERNATISVLEEAKLLKLSKESLDELTEEYPALFEDLKRSAADRTG